MAVALVIQARASSARLPGKVLADLGHGWTVLGLLLARLRTVPGGHPIVLATSDGASDDPLAEWAATRDGIRLHRGPLDDVLGRLAAATRATGAGAVLRVCGDSPFLDPAVVQRALRLHAEAPGAVVSNARPRSFPRGQTVELVPAAILERMDAEAGTPFEREHATRWLHERPARADWRTFAARTDESARQQSIDVPEDLERARAILARAVARGLDPRSVDWRTLARIEDELAATTSAPTAPCGSAA